MPAYLVTGNPGSGKSSVAAALVRRGLDAIDADDDAALSHWEAPDGQVIPLGDAPLHPDREWLEAHRWVWDRCRLSTLVASTGDAVFVCGIALNIAQVADLFDGLFLLEIDGGTQESRLAAHDAMHPPGRNEAGRQQIRDGRVVFQAQIKRLGARSIDATRPTSAVVDELLAHVELGGR